MDTKLIGERIKAIRKDNNLNQASFGAKIGVSQDTISLWENGKSVPAIEYVIIIVKKFRDCNGKITSDYLLGLDSY